MVIPPEQKQLTPEENIFDLIDSIQSKISSQEYVDLMNTAQQLVQKIKDSEQEEEMSVISDSSSTDGYQNPMSDSSSDDDEIEETSYTRATALQGSLILMIFQEMEIIKHIARCFVMELEFLNARILSDYAKNILYFII